MVRDFCGHGIGQVFHDRPMFCTTAVPARGWNWRRACSSPIEPMINLGRPDVLILDDGWTAVTRDKSLSAQWEHTIAVTEDGHEVFTLSPAGRTPAALRRLRLRPMAGEKKPDHASHRKRLRRRFLDGGAAALPDYELLELLLTMAIPARRREASRQGAHGPLQDLRCGRERQRRRSQDGRGPGARSRPSPSRSCGPRRIACCRRSSPARTCCRASTPSSPTARPSWRSSNASSSASCSSTARTGSSPTKSNRGAPWTTRRSIPARSRAAPSSSTRPPSSWSHNHPSGDPTPSRADIAMTAEIVAALKAVGVVVHDHIVMARGGHASLRALGHL